MEKQALELLLELKKQRDELRDWQTQAVKELQDLATVLNGQPEAKDGDGGVCRAVLAYVTRLRKTLLEAQLDLAATKADLEMTSKQSNAAHDETARLRTEIVRLGDELTAANDANLTMCLGSSNGNANGVRKSFVAATS